MTNTPLIDNLIKEYEGKGKTVNVSPSKKNRKKPQKYKSLLTKKHKTLDSIKCKK